MKRSDWALLALNLFTAFMSFVSAVEGDQDFGLLIFALLGVTLTLNMTTLFRRDRQRDDGSRRRSARPSIETDEMDARTILDLDARLEALERAQDASDAARWRALAATGQAVGPAAETSPDVDADRQRLNGRA